MSNQENMGNITPNVVVTSLFETNTNEWVNTDHNSIESNSQELKSSTLPSVLTHSLVYDNSSIPFDERPLPLPKPETIRPDVSNKNTQSQCVMEFNNTKDYVYVLLKFGTDVTDGNILCFSPNRSDMIKMFQFYKSQIISAYSCTGSERIYTDVNRNTLNIYFRNSNFFFNYDKLLASFKIVKVPHFRTQMFHEKELLRQD